MNAAIREIVIWAHSECKSTMSLFREVKRQAGVPVTIALWKYGEGDDVRRLRETQGQSSGEYDDLSLVPIGENIARGRALLASHGGSGTIQVFCVYQVSSVWRKLICEAKDGGAKTAIYAEAPCEMCVGLPAKLKRLYYRTILPVKLRRVINASDKMLCASGVFGITALQRIGWPFEKIIPFGYASAVPKQIEHREDTRLYSKSPLRILHTGLETPNRGIKTLLEACRILEDRNVRFVLVRTGGKATKEDVSRLFASSDVFVACGLCEPWGMRVNDAIHARISTVVSRGMGAFWLVDQFKCGWTFPAGDAQKLADIFQMISNDRGKLAEAGRAAKTASEAWTPQARARVFLEAVSS